MGLSRPDRRWRRSLRRRVGSLLIGAGAVLVGLAALAATGVVPLWRPSVPAPPAAVLVADAAPTADRRALEGWTRPVVTRTPRVLRADERWSPTRPVAAAAPAPAPDQGGRVATTQPTPRPAPTALPTFTPWPTLTPWPSPTLWALDQWLASWPAAATPWPSPSARPTAVPPLPAPGLPWRLVVPSIQVDTPVVPLATRVDPGGTVEWDTVPFVAGHYGMTGLVGARANVVLSGHVTTQGMGNVFRELHRLRPGEPLVVHTEAGEFTYRVETLRLVAPTDVGVLEPTAEPSLTLVTCAGEFDFRTQNFTQRLVVSGRLVTG